MAGGKTGKKASATGKNVKGPATKSAKVRATRRWTRKVNARDQLLDAASALMIEKGSIEISLGQIAAKAGLNSALVAYYFGSKEGLLMALVRRNAERAVHSLQKLSEVDLTSQDKMRKHLAGVINFHFQYPYTTRLMHFLMRDPNSENSREITQMFSAPVRATQEKILREGIKSRTFRKMDPVLFFFSALGACDYIFWGSSALHFMFGVENVDEAMRCRFIEHTTELFLRGCLADPGGQPSKPGKGRKQ